MVRNYHDDAKWIPGTVLKKLGPVTYSVDRRDGWTVKRHILVDQLHQNVHRSPKSTSNTIDDYYCYELVTPVQDVDPVPRTPPSRLIEHANSNAIQFHSEDYPVRVSAYILPGE